VHEFAWLTKFNSAGVRIESARGWTAIAQWLDGETYVAPGGMRLGFPFDATFLLLSKRTGAHTLSARYDHFEVRSDSSPDEDSGQRGHAWTLAYVFAPNARWKLTLEWLSVTSDSGARVEYFATAGLATEHKLEGAVRYALGPAAR
jgi:phosphate-selective porin